MNKKINDILQHNDLTAIIHEHNVNHEYDKLFNELESLIEFLEEKNICLPELINYSITHYWQQFNLNKNCSRFIRYFSNIPPEKWKKEQLASVINTFSMLRYEELASSDEYIAFMNIIHTLSKPERENQIVLKNNHMFKDLKVGFLSSDLCAHPVGKFILALLKNKLNYETITYYAFDTKGRSDDLQNAIKESVFKFYDVSEYDDSKITTMILDTELDILIDLNGLSRFTKINLMSTRLAPIQMSYIGFPGTTGYYNIDYTIVDRITDPPGFSHEFYTEKLIYLDKSFLCCTCEPPEDIVSYVPPCIKNGYVTVGSFVNLHKYSNHILSLWKIIMDKIPNIRFLIQSFFLKTTEDIEFQKKIFLQFGIDVNRIDFFIQDQLDNYFCNYNKVDFILDTFPFNGATTTCDAFSMSVPILTLAGNTHVSRVTASMLININMPELIAYGDNEYIQKAMILSTDTNYLLSLRKIIRNRFMNSPLTNTVSFKMELESKFRDIYIKYIVNKNEPQTFNNLSIQSSAREALTSLFYLQDMIIKTETDMKSELSSILIEATCVNLNLYEFLKNEYKENENALNILDHYQKLSNLLTTTQNNKTLIDIISSIKKIIHMFIV